VPKKSCKKTMDLDLILDQSNSIGKKDMKKLKKFAAKLVDSFEIGPNKTRVAIIPFHFNATVKINFGDYTKKQILKTIQELSRPRRRSHLTTYINIALETVNTRVFTQASYRPEAERVIYDF